MKTLWCVVCSAFLMGSAAYGEDQPIVSAPVIVSLVPEAAQAGAQVKVTGSGFSKDNNTVTVRNLRREEAVLPAQKSENGTEIVFAVPQELKAPDTPFMTEMEKATAKVDITPGFYDVFVDNKDSGKTSNVKTLEVVKTDNSR